MLKSSLPAIKISAFPVVKLTRKFLENVQEFIDPLSVALLSDFAFLATFKSYQRETCCPCARAILVTWVGIIYEHTVFKRVHLSIYLQRTQEN